MCWRKYSGLMPIGEVPPNVLAKVQWTYANWRSSTECIGESTVDVRQLAKFHRMHWINRKYVYDIDEYNLPMWVRKRFLVYVYFTMTLLKDHCTFANWRNSTECIGESIVDVRQLAKFQRPYWRKYSGLSPIGEAPPNVLVKVQWTFAIGESPIGESLIGEIPEPRNFLYFNNIQK
ncbi:unnamed protein product [Rotaria socialis]